MKDDKNLTPRSREWWIDSRYFEMSNEGRPCQATQALSVPVDGFIHVLEFTPARLAAEEIEAALRGIIEIGKRDMSNPKYDSYFEFAKEALSKAKVGGELVTTRLCPPRNLKVTNKARGGQK